LIPPPPTSTLFPYTTLFRSLPESHGSVDSRYARGLAAKIFCAPTLQCKVVCKAALPAGRVSAHLRFFEMMVGTVSSRRRLDNPRSEEHTSELQSLRHLVCRL